MATPKRPADVPMPASTVPVELNDDLHVTVESLTQEPVLVEWSQNWGTKKSDTYYAVTFSNVTRDKDPGRLFIASKYVDVFKSASQLVDDGKVYSFKVTNKFRYGQDAEGKNRFLVLDDHSNDIFQHRFASNKKIHWATKAGDIVTGAANRGKEEAKMGINLIISKWGNELRKF
ncbi:hypothetical protein DER46DRAFT_650144 [Fusarium sp. MPI-SDFR-AT-0072]|uniref:Uncharacterized protein n=1 Tax=Fusarium oxysporum f. sp. rapae TaxID=485398 RepID=A0A8J5TSZ1_FUSOX|nr:hypothetical protein Forpe1208_v011057 [Fusarium oxysporum f. sp. rapae]KAH7150908.1 hypothetical protein DER46DRAFT_650144 [Fusarium sp. MPI-SDFR-AT-0072]